MRQLELWPDDPPDEVDDVPEAGARAETPADLVSLTAPVFDASELAPAAATVDGPPIPAPLPGAIEAGVFGMTPDGPIGPDQKQIETLTAEQANEMMILLADSQVLEEAIRLEYDPATGRTPATPEAKQSLLARLDKERKRLVQAYDDAIGAYAEGFGDSAAKALDEWVRKTVADGDQEKEPYPPTHPWHYFHAGDNATPIPVDQIEADPNAGHWLVDRLPKNPKKRLQAMREMLELEQASLAADKERYIDIVQRGAESLSRFDREIAHTSDAIAVATALALKYNHISAGLGRVAWLTNELERLAPEPKGLLGDRQPTRI